MPIDPDRPHPDLADDAHDWYRPILAEFRPRGTPAGATVPDRAVTGAGAALDARLWLDLTRGIRAERRR